MTGETTAGETSTGEETERSGVTVSTEQQISTTETMIEVDAEHPEVQAIVQEAVKAAEEQKVTLAAEVYTEVMEEAVQQAEREMRERNPAGPL